MNNFEAASIVEIETAQRRIAIAQSLDEIRAIVERFSAAATRDGGVLYCGMINAKDHSGKIARVIADKTDVAIIDDTPRGQLFQIVKCRRASKVRQNESSMVKGKTLPKPSVQRALPSTATRKRRRKPRRRSRTVCRSKSHLRE